MCGQDAPRNGFHDPYLQMISPPVQCLHPESAHLMRGATFAMNIAITSRLFAHLP